MAHRRWYREVSFTRRQTNVTLAHLAAHISQRRRMTAAAETVAMTTPSASRYFRFEASLSELEAANKGSGDRRRRTPLRRRFFL